jgi:hypothetical protein|tara:strand:+ start:5700 stop:5843 length:144 start_codon:yes stop_codon:yes gene_type:complete
MTKEIEELQDIIRDAPLNWSANVKLGRLIKEYGDELDAQQDKELKEL